MSKYNLKDIYEGMSDKDYDAAKEAERLEKHPERDKIKAVQAMMAKEKSSKNESNIQEMTRDTFERMDGLVNQNLLREFLDAFEEIYSDYHEGGDPFDASEVIDFLSIMMQNRAQDAKLDSKMFEDSKGVESIEELDGSGSVDALTALLGAGGLTAGAFALNKMMDALEAGKLGDKGKAIAKHLRDMGSTFKGAGLKEGDSIVDEIEFNFFQTILDGRYKEEDIEEYLKSDDYQQALQTLNLDASDTEEWIGEFANYFGDGADAYIDEISKEDKKLKEHFSRFLKDYN